MRRFFYSLLCGFVWTRRHSRRAVAIKLFVTATMAAVLFNHPAALPMALFGNLVWVWFDQEKEEGGK